MKYTIAIETTQYVEVESETAEAAIELAKSQLDPRVAAAAAFQVVQELTYDEESGSYKML
jgi:hypothetical protein